MLDALSLLGPPFAFFLMGVAASDFLRLHDIPRGRLYVMGVFTGMFAVGFMVTSDSYESELIEGIRDVGYGFTESAPNYLKFVAILAFMGMGTPALFHELLRRFGTAPAAGRATGRATGGAPQGPLPGA